GAQAEQIGNKKTQIPQNKAAGRMFPLIPGAVHRRDILLSSKQSLCHPALEVNMQDNEQLPLTLLISAKEREPASQNCETSSQTAPPRLDTDRDPHRAMPLSKSHYTRLAHWGVTLSGAKGLTARGFAALGLTRQRGDSGQWTNVRWSDLGYTVVRLVATCAARWIFLTKLL